jgi:hypothetical protein
VQKRLGSTHPSTQGDIPTLTAESPAEAGLLKGNAVRSCEVLARFCTVRFVVWRARFSAE